MARVKMLKSACGPLGSFQEGKQYDDMDDDFALALAEAGAVILLDAPGVERAVMTAPENALAPAQQVSRRRR